MIHDTWPGDEDVLDAWLTALKIWLDAPLGFHEQGYAERMYTYIIGYCCYWAGRRRTRPDDVTG